MFIFTGRGAVGSADIHLAKADLGFIVLIQCPSVRFRWARGANARETPQGERGNSLRSHSPLSLGFPSRALPSVILSPLKGVNPVLWRIEYAKSSVYSSCGTSNRLPQVSNSCQVRDLRPRGKGNQERGARGENLKGKGECELASFPLLLWVLPSHSRLAPNKI